MITKRKNISFECSQMLRAIVTLRPAYSFISVKIVVLNRFYIISMRAFNVIPFTSTNAKWALEHCEIPLLNKLMNMQHNGVLYYVRDMPLLIKSDIFWSFLKVHIHLEIFINIRLSLNTEKTHQPAYWITFIKISYSQS